MHHNLRRRGQVALVAACAAVAACKGKDSAKPAPAPADINVQELLSPAAVGERLVARGGATVDAKTVLHVAPTGTNAAGLAGAQDVTTDGSVQLDAHGHYALREENDQDGGREIYFTGQDLAVKLRYGKLTKRNARAPEPTRLLEQALGGPAAFWEIFGPAAVIRTGSSQGFATIAVSLGEVRTQQEPPAPSPTASAALSVWRRTAVPTALAGEIKYLPADGKHAATLVHAHLTGTFTARATASSVEGKMEVSFAAKEIGHVGEVAMPEEAQDLRLGQRTILEERALLEGLPIVKPPPRR